MKIKTLIVDDENIVRKGICAMLSNGCSDIEIVGEAASGAQALEFLEHHSVELLFCDITMPNMSGLTLLQQVNQRFPLVKTVILTCHQDFEYVREALRKGAIDYIVKTQIDEENLEQLMEGIVKRIRNGRTDQPMSPKGVSIEEMKEFWKSLQWIMDEDYLTKMFEEADQWEEDDRISVMKEAIDSWTNKLSFMASEHWLTEVKDVSYTGMRRFLQNAAEPLKARFLKSGYHEDVIRSVIQALDYIHNNLGGRLSQSEVCAAVNMSSGYLSKSFKEIMGITFAGYLQDVNIQYAGTLLLTTNQPVYWIAEKCGFQDEKYFSRLFKVKMGMLPSKYRQCKR